jgi:methylated-DNA-[protein]-cysteine S-methyltransferase
MKSYAYLHSPAGLLEVVERAGKIVSISFCSSEKHVSHTNILLDEAILELEAYFKGAKVFNLPLELEGSKFEKEVYRALMSVPYGHTLSYKELATLAGHPNAYRAVGSAMAKNKFVIVVPCHRVIKEDGSLGHYSGIHGVKTKEFLLEHEKSFLG